MNEVERTEVWSWRRGKCSAVNCIILWDGILAILRFENKISWYSWPEISCILYMLALATVNREFSWLWLVWNCSKTKQKGGQQPSQTLDIILLKCTSMSKRHFWCCARSKKRFARHCYRNRIFFLIKYKKNSFRNLTSKSARSTCSRPVQLGLGK